MKSKQLSKSRRAILLAKRLRAKHGLTVDLTIACYELRQPETYDGPPWPELIARLAAYELVVWRSMVFSLQRLTSRSACGNPTMGPRRR